MDTSRSSVEASKSLEREVFSPLLGSLDHIDWHASLASTGYIEERSSLPFAKETYHSPTCDGNGMQCNKDRRLVRCQANDWLRDVDSKVRGVP